MYNLVKQFKASESGAVTTDWIVLAVGLVVLGIFVVSSVLSGTLDLALELDTSLVTIEPGSGDS